MDWRHIADLIRAALQSYDEFANLCVWVKDNGGMGSFYRSQHELVGLFAKAKVLTGTTFSSGSSAAIGPMSGNIPVSKRCRSRAGKGICSRFIQP
jgi:hypothetical protein